MNRYLLSFWYRTKWSTWRKKQNVVETLQPLPPMNGDASLAFAEDLGRAVMKAYGLSEVYIDSMMLEQT